LSSSEAFAAATEGFECLMCHLCNA